MKKRWIALLLALTMLLGVLPVSALAGSALPFTDVKGSDWFYDGVKYVYENGLMSGTGTATFSPNTATTRGMIVTILHRMEGEPAAAGEAFTDVEAGQYYAAAVAWASANKIVGGYGNGTFGPNDPITREQLAAILYRYAQFKGMDVSAKGDISRFSDRAAVSSYAVEAMTWAVGAGLLTGVGANTLDPKGHATRAQIATILMRFCEPEPAEEEPEETEDKGSSDPIVVPNPNPRPDPTVSYTVTFEPNGGSAVESQTVEAGQTAVRPDDPTKDGYRFVAWYSDNELTAEYDFSSSVEADITLYAKWRVQDNLEDDIIDLGDIENLISDGLIEVIYGENGDIRIIDGPFTDKEVTSVEDAAEILNLASSLFGDEFYADAEDITWQNVGENTEEEEYFYRFAPAINGIMVLGSQIILSTDGDGSVTGLFSTFDEDIYDVDFTADITSDAATAVAISQVMAQEDVRDFLENLPDYTENSETILATFEATLSAETTLMIYAADNDTKPVLVYAVTVTRYCEEEAGESEIEIVEDAPIIDATYYVYANGVDCGSLYRVIQNPEGWTAVALSGTDLLNQTRYFNGEEEDGTYRLKDTSRNLITYKTGKTGALWWTEYVLPGNIATSMSFFGERIDKTAVSAHANMTDVYDFYLNVLGRRSFNGNGATVTVSYDYGSNYQNAYWSSDLQQFVFGSGDDYAAALDVVGHEYTHAVINYVVGNGRTTTLTYRGETGALNEAYADIMGSFAEGKTGNGFWTIAEDMGSVMRSMENPAAYGQADHYSALSDPEWSARLDQYVNRDNEGVHIFGGVFCNATYRMMSDSRCSGISQTTWAKVFYRSLFRLATNATFLDARGAVLCAAKNLGFNQTQQQAIKDAFDAVGITEPDSIRIVLQWGETPRDLDSHIVGPGVTPGSRFHVYFGNRSYYRDGTYNSLSSLYAVDLDYDDVTSYGPEVTTIHLLTEGEYYFYVHDFTNGQSDTCTEMANSGATVSVYRGSSNNALYTFHVDPSSSGTYWNVFKLTIQAGGNIAIEPINTYGASPTYS